MKKTLTALAFITACAPAHAQQYGVLPLQFCSDTETVRGMAQNNFNESVSFQGLSSPIHIDELFFDTEDGSYSYLRTNIEQNITCVLATGVQGFVTIPQVKPSL
jgi:hypothetical protein